MVLDPGHGGPYIGAADATGTLVEKILTLQVAKAAAADLKRLGYTVYLTRTRDQAVNTPPRDLNHDGKIEQLDDYDARTLFANRHHADIFISIHFDGSDDPTQHGTHGYYCPARSFWKSSVRLADLLTASVSGAIKRAGYADPNNGVQTDVADKVPQEFPDYPWFFVLGPSWPRRITGTAMPGALIETLYLSNPRDADALRRSLKPAGRHGMIDAIGQGYANGIRAYFHNKVRR